VSDTAGTVSLVVETGESMTCLDIVLYTAGIAVSSTLAGVLITFLV
jgi:hypothetical protein